MAKKEVVNKLLEESLNQSLLTYIQDNLKDRFNKDIEIALAIYIKLAELFWYDPNYVADNDLNKIKNLSDISVINNELICLHWAVIYSKILDAYGIDNRLLGDDEHLLVKVNAADYVIFTDATRYGIGAKDYKLADLTNTKLGLKIDGIYTLNEKKSEELDILIDEVYSKLNIPVYDTKKLDLLLEKFRIFGYKRLKNKKENGLPIIDKKEIDKRVKFLNYFYNLSISLREVERLQIFSKYYRNIFEGIPFDKCRCITMCEPVSGKLHLIRMLILADDNKNIYYYLESPKGFIEYNKEEMIEVLISRNIQFRYETSNVLGFDDKEVKKLSKNGI